MELGHIDLISEVSVIYLYCVSIRGGQLQLLLNISIYLKSYHNSRIVFDLSYPELDIDNFPCHDWNQFYGDLKKEVSGACPNPSGKKMFIRTFVDADFVGEQMSMRSKTGFIIMLNNLPTFDFQRSNCRVRLALLIASLWPGKNVANI